MISFIFREKAGHFKVQVEGNKCRYSVSKLEKVQVLSLPSMGKLSVSSSYTNENNLKGADQLISTQLHNGLLNANL